VESEMVPVRLLQERCEVGSTSVFPVSFYGFCLVCEKLSIVRIFSALVT